MKAPEDPQLKGLREQLARLRVEEVQQRLLKALVLWEMNYVREAVSQFRVTAENVLHRLVAHAAALDAAAAKQRVDMLARGQAGKVIDWLYRDASVIPARVALHLHTLLGWGSYASHHQQEGHSIEVGDLGVLITIAIDLEDWVVQKIDGGDSILSDHVGDEELATAIARATHKGVPPLASEALIQALGEGLTADAHGFRDQNGGIELFWSQPLAREGAPSAYHGLRAFGPEDAPHFFGRNKSLQEVSAGLADHLPVLLSGESGAGKTSLLRAGVLPKALAAHTPVLYLSEPSATLLTATIKMVGAWPSSQPLLLVVDQFERAMFGDVPSDERQLALEFSLRAGAWAGIQFIAGIREDYLGRYWRETARIDSERSARVRDRHKLVVLDPMGLHAAGEVITGIAARGGLSIDSPFMHDHLLPDLCVDHGVPAVHLQIVCMTLVEAARTRASTTIDETLYDTLGGAQKMLSEHLSRALSSSHYDQRRVIAQTILKRLAGREGRRWADHGDLWQALRRGGHQVDELELVELLTRLQQDRLVVTRRGESISSPMVSLSHDVLSAKVLGWTTREEAERGQAQAVLDHALKQCTEDPHSEPLSGKNLRLVENHGQQLEGLGSPAAVVLLKRSRRLRLTKRSILVALVLSAAVGVVFGAFQFRAALREQVRAKEAADLGVLLSARIAMQRDPSLAVAWLRHLSLRGQGIAIRSMLDEARQRGVAHVLAGHRALVTSVAFSPRGHTLISGDRDNIVRFWDFRRAKPLRRQLSGHTGFITRAVYSPDGSMIATSSWDKTIRLWHAKTGEPAGRPLKGHRHWVYDVAYSPDGKMLASAGYGGEIRLWRGHEGMGTIRASDEGLLCVAFSKDAKHVLSAGLDGVVRVWNLETKALTHAFEGHSGAVYALRVAADGDTIVSASIDSTVRVWSLSTEKSVGILRGHSDGVIALAVSPDGKMVASGGEDKLILLWDLQSRAPAGVPLRGHIGFIRALAFSSDGATLASASQDQTIRVWNLPSRNTGGSERSLPHNSWVQAIAATANGQLLATGTRRGVVQLWYADSSAPASDPIQMHDDAVSDLSFTPDGKLLASAARDGTIRLWTVGKDAPHPANHSTQGGGVYSLAFGEHDMLVSGAGDGTLQRWRVSSKGALRAEGSAVLAHSKAVLTLRRAPHGALLASGSRDQLVRLWHSATLKPQGEAMRGHTDEVYDVAFSPDGQRVASASGDGTVRIWSAASPTSSPLILTGHQHWVLSVAFSPKGNLLASGSSDSTVRLWDATTGRPLEAPLFGHTDWVYGVVFSPDGKLLASASGDKTVKLWQVGAAGSRSVLDEINELTNLHVSSVGKTTIH
ncbi:MAG: WD40 repeat domain-containing protein [Deltaproteobacteria bacterium]|nr:WD40 repeat domain-containing protein [Deltaproteobacteria bacterium]